MQNELLDEGLMLMLAGMGTVFVFLTALVIAMTLMSRLAMRIQPSAVPTSSAADTGDEEIAAITAAIRRHRNQ